MIAAVLLGTVLGAIALVLNEARRRPAPRPVRVERPDEGRVRPGRGGR